MDADELPRLYPMTKTKAKTTEFGQGRIDDLQKLHGALAKGGMKAVEKHLWRLLATAGSGCDRPRET